MSELILGPIVGGLTGTQTYIWGRTDGPATLHAWMGHQPDLSDAELKGTSPLTLDSGYTGVVVVAGLTPATHYHYAVTLNDAPPPPAEAPYPEFATFPSEGVRQSFSFVFGSCFCPEDENGGEIFYRIESLRQRRAADPKRSLRFMLLIGDQIYADDFKHNGLGNKGAVTLQNYRDVYQYTWSRPPFRRLLTNMPAFMTLDDHEVDDDWTWIDFERTRPIIPWWDRLARWWNKRPEEEYRISKGRVQDALKAYWEHQGMHARGYVDLLAFDPERGRNEMKPGDETSYAYAFDYGAAAFFVLDTRTRRVKKNWRQRTMLGEGQWEALEKWLLETKDTHPVKFIITSCALLFQMWADIPKDRWTGFQEERQRLLGFLAANGIEGVHLLTGDLHSAHAVSANLRGPGGRAIPLWEFCSSPFEQIPNWLAKYTYWPVRSKSIRDQRLHFVCAEHNFGVVSVEFSGDGKPKVSFELHQGNGEPPINLQG
ncbi:MAG: alkaline phosphatase D family protein [Chloroflexota bacterium]